MIDTIKNRELSFGEVLSTSWWHYKKNFMTILFIIVLLYTPYYLLMGSSIINFNFYSYGSYANFDNLLLLDRVSSFVTELIFGIAAMLAVIFIVDKSVNGEKLSYFEAIKMAFLKWFRGASTSIARNIVVFLGIILLLFPGLYVGIIYAFAIPVAILRDQSCLSAMKYSRKIVKGRWWKIFGVFLSLFY